MNAKYIVIEIQTSVDGSVANLVTAYDDKNQAESAYHMVLAAAAVSSLPCHSAMIVTNDGSQLMFGYYVHDVELEVLRAGNAADVSAVVEDDAAEKDTVESASEVTEEDVAEDVEDNAEK